MLKVRDTLELETPAGDKEWAFLQGTKVGDIREGVLFPAVEVGVDWICTATGEGYWEFDGRFFGQPLCHVVIKEHDKKLTLSVKEPS